MRSWIAALTLGLFAAQSCLTGQARAAPRPAEQAPAPAPAPNPRGDALTPEGKPAGGIVPCLLTCYIGPRAGLEYNEGRKIAQIEWIELIATLVPLAGPLIKFGIRLVTGGIPAMNRCSRRRSARRARRSGSTSVARSSWRASPTCPPSSARGAARSS